MTESSTLEDTMRYLKPWTTLAVGVIIGWQVLPRVMQRVG